MPMDLYGAQSYLPVCKTCHLSLVDILNLAELFVAGMLPRGLHLHECHLIPGKLVIARASRLNLCP